jgi:methyl-accepting chemotaxis protein
MGKFEVDYDPKTQSITIDHDNILADARKQYKELLDVGAFQVAAQLPLGVEMPNEKALEKAVVKRAEELEREINKEVDDLFKELEKLQKAEQGGNKKAGDEAVKRVKAADKSLKGWAGEIGAELRKVIQKEIKSQTGAKPALRSVSRTLFRGLELQEDAFEGVEAEEEIPDNFPGAAKSLAKVGKEASSLAAEEKATRLELGAIVESIYKAIEKQRGTSFDIQEFAKQNDKSVKSVESAAKKYAAAVNGLQKELDSAGKALKKIEKLIGSSDVLKKDKQVAGAAKDFVAAHDTVEKYLKDKHDAAKQAAALFDGNYGRGEAWKSLLAVLTAKQGATKSGDTLRDSSAALEKAAKG